MYSSFHVAIFSWFGRLKALLILYINLCVVDWKPSSLGARFSSIANLNTLNPLIKFGPHPAGCAPGEADGSPDHIISILSL